MTCLNLWYTIITIFISHFDLYEESSTFLFLHKVLHIRNRKLRRHLGIDMSQWRINTFIAKFNIYLNSASFNDTTSIGKIHSERSINTFIHTNGHVLHFLT